MLLFIYLKFKGSIMKKAILLVLFVFSLSLFAQEKFIIYTYHNHSPFINSQNSGLSYDVVRYLNTQAKGKYLFELKVIPRSRLNYILKPWINKDCLKIRKCDANWMVLWVNQKWGFGQDSLSNFSWTALLQDSNVIISSSKADFYYTKPEDLIGKKLAGMAGHRYLGIDDLVDSGKIKRINGNTEVENLKVVLSKRVDATLLPKSTFEYYQKTNTEFKKLYASDVSHQDYMRNIMTVPQNKELIAYFNSLDLSEIFK